MLLPKCDGLNAAAASTAGWAALVVCVLATSCSGEGTKQTAKVPAAVPSAAPRKTDASPASDDVPVALTAEEIAQYQPQAEKLLSLVRTPAIASYEASFAVSTAFDDIQKTTGLFQALRDGPGRAVSEAPELQELLGQSWITALTLVPHKGSRPGGAAIVEAVGEPARKQAGEFKYETHSQSGGTEVETIPVEWHHWAWASAAIHRATDQCVAVRINTVQWRSARQMETKSGTPSADSQRE